MKDSIQLSTTRSIREISHCKGFENDRSLAKRQSESRNCCRKCWVYREGEAVPSVKLRRLNNMTKLMKCKAFVASAGINSVSFKDKFLSFFFFAALGATEVERKAAYNHVISGVVREIEMLRD